jgi:hypothetical protein
MQVFVLPLIDPKLPTAVFSSLLPILLSNDLVHNVTYLSICMPCGFRLSPKTVGADQIALQKKSPHQSKINRELRYFVIFSNTISSSKSVTLKVFNQSTFPIWKANNVSYMCSLPLASPPKASIVIFTHSFLTTHQCTKQSFYVHHRSCGRKQGTPCIWNLLVF